MVKVGVLVEFQRRWANAFGRHAAAVASEAEAVRQAESLIRRLPGIDALAPAAARCAPVPLFSPEAVFGARGRAGFGAFATGGAAPDVAADSVVVACEVEPGRLEALRARAPRVRVWPDSPLTLDQWRGTAGSSPDGRGGSGGGPDCPPFRPASTADAARLLLGVAPLWQRGFRGEGVVVGLLGEGVHGATYPVAGGGTQAAGTPQPGGAPVIGHGSTLAAGVLIAAPGAALYDYPFRGVPTSGAVLALLQAVLGRRRLDGTPHLTCHGYGLATVPPRDASPDHEAWSRDHPLHRKLREVVASGVACLFGAGDCGAPCPGRSCGTGAVGPGRSIHGPNGLAEVITVAAVNGRGERIGYSAQGPGRFFDPRKPDVSACAHVLGHFGPGRPGGTRVARFDAGSAAAAAVATGVGALLLGAFPGAVTPGLLKEALTRGAVPAAGAADGGENGAGGWSPDTGHGVVNAGGAYDWLRAALASS